MKPREGLVSAELELSGDFPSGYTVCASHWYVQRDEALALL